MAIVSRTIYVRTVLWARRRWQALCHRRAAKHLLELNDRELKDIGLMREDIIRTFANRNLIDATRTLGDLAQERRNLRDREARERQARDRS